MLKIGFMTLAAGALIDPAGSQHIINFSEGVVNKIASY